MVEFLADYWQLHDDVAVILHNSVLQMPLERQHSFARTAFNLLTKKKSRNVRFLHSVAWQGKIDLYFANGNLKKTEKYFKLRLEEFCLSAVSGTVTGSSLFDVVAPVLGMTSIELRILFCGYVTAHWSKCSVLIKSPKEHYVGCMRQDGWPCSETDVHVLAMMLK